MYSTSGTPDNLEISGPGGAFAVLLLTLITTDCQEGSTARKLVLLRTST